MGSGYYIIAFTVVMFMMFAMLVLKPLIFRYHQRDIQYLLRVTLHDRICMKRLIDELISEGIEIIKVNFEYDGQKESVEAVAEVRLSHYDKNKNFVSEMSIKDEVLELTLI